MRLRNRIRRLVATGLLLGVSVSVPAFAQSTAQPYPACTKVVSTSESELAHQKYIAGKQDYDEANYDTAIRRFRDAYTLDCQKHELLVIISAAYERRGDRKEAITALETYIQRVPNAPDLVTYQRKIENLRSQIAAQPPPSSSTAPAPTAAPAADSGGHTALPWVVVGLGGAAVVTGVILLVAAPERPDNCDADRLTCSPPPRGATLDEDQEQAGRNRGMVLAGRIFVGGGAALVVGGLLWHFLEPTGPREARIKLRPSYVPGYAGLSLGGGF
jgi:tetratricopeptide (TPR) repeat protein